MVASWEYVRHCLFLCHFCPCHLDLGREAQHHWHQPQFDSTYFSYLPHHSQNLNLDVIKVMWAILYGWTPEIFGTKGKNHL